MHWIYTFTYMQLTNSHNYSSLIDRSIHNPYRALYALWRRDSHCTICLLWKVLFNCLFKSPHFESIVSFCFDAWMLNILKSMLCFQQLQVIILNDLSMIGNWFLWLIDIHLCVYIHAVNNSTDVAISDWQSFEKLHT